MSTKCCITFAGAVGSSKTPIANYLSTMLNLPVLNNDAIRTEVREDLLAFDRAVYDKRQEERCKAMLATGKSFIYDASVDRKWTTFTEWLTDYGYTCFIISLDVSPELLHALYVAKNYTDFEDLPAYIEQHASFVSRHKAAINVSIDDANFANRLTIAYEAVNQWLQKTNAH